MSEAVATDRQPVGRAEAVLRYVAERLVAEPEAVGVTDVARGRVHRLELRVAPEDTGRVIGRQGRVAHALRVLVRAAASLDGEDASVEICDE